MPEYVLNPRDNHFISEHVDDRLYKKIVSEISTRTNSTNRKKAGSRIALTPEMLRDFLYYVSMGCDLKDSAAAVNLAEKTRQDYNRKSPTFSGVTDLARRNLSLRARITLAKAIIGQMPQYYKIVDPDSGKPKYIELKEIPPNVNVAMWWLEKVDNIGGEEKNDAPQLGAPRNEVEAELLEKLLNKHHDYVQAKKDTRK